MRDYKFRGKRVDNGEWVYGCYWFNGIDTHFIKIIKRDTENVKYFGSHTEDIEVIPETIGQYTGAIDCDEKEIYENDIVGIQMETPNEIYKAIVKFEDFQWYLDPLDWDKWIEDWNFIDDSCRFKVLGTIYDSEE